MTLEQKLEALQGLLARQEILIANLAAEESNVAANNSDMSQKAANYEKRTLDSEISEKSSLKSFCSKMASAPSSINMYLRNFQVYRQASSSNRVVTRKLRNLEQRAGKEYYRLQKRRQKAENRAKQLTMAVQVLQSEIQLEKSVAAAKNSINKQKKRHKRR